MASRDAAPLLGGIEAGGTKFVLAVGPSPREIVSRTVIPTTTPDRTLAEVTHWFAEHGPVVALGIASFGPVELDRASPNWGYITDTPKPGWAQTDIAGPLAKALACPVGFDTDVNGAALAEATYGAGGTSLAYITVGTGIGVGLVTGGTVDSPDRSTAQATPRWGISSPGATARTSTFPATARSTATAWKGSPADPRSSPAGGPCCPTCRRGTLRIHMSLAISPSFAIRPSRPSRSKRSCSAAG